MELENCTCLLDLFKNVMQLCDIYAIVLVISYQGYILCYEDVCLSHSDVSLGSFEGNEQVLGGEQIGDAQTSVRGLQASETFMHHSEEFVYVLQTSTFNCQVSDLREQFWNYTIKN